MSEKAYRITPSGKGQYSINGGPWTDDPGFIKAGDQIRWRVTMSPQDPPVHGIYIGGYRPTLWQRFIRALGL